MVLIYQENVFCKNRHYRNSTFWQCVDHKTLKCKCRCVTTANEKLRVSKVTHSHPPNASDFLKNSSFALTTRLKTKPTDENVFELSELV